jgi:hypothetical protein
MICTALVSVAALAGSPDVASQESPAASVSTWGEGLEMDHRVAEGISRYSKEKDDLGAAYPEAIAAAVRRVLFRDAASALAKLPAVGSETSIEVTFPDPGFAAADGRETDDEHQRKFEEGFVRIEVLATFAVEGVTPEEALRMYTGEEFRMETSSRIKRIWTENDLSCVEVRGVKALLSPTLACNRIDELLLPRLAAQHSQVVSNPGGDDYQTVYFKESLKTFVEVPGGLVLHYVNYARAVKLGSIKRSFGRGRIAASEEEKIEALRNHLSNGIE